MIKVQSIASMGQDERDKIKLAKQAAAEETFDGRKAASNWEEFQKFEKEVRFKIRTEVNSIKMRGEESIKRADDSIGVSPESFEKIKTEQEIKIQEIRIEGMRLGEKAQEVVNDLASEIREKIKKGEFLEGISPEEASIQDEIGKQIAKIQKMYEDFLKEIEKIRQKMDELLFDMENNLREARIKEVEEDINIKQADE